ncbi:hypothetical protein [Kordia sp.]|uniref:hypothetical protein n=1 Tax=Kordia sp. TaxID=1965332 RepID=UPI003D2BC582
MSTIDQNNAMLSLEQALVPKSNLIDGRSEKDQLRMLVDFASLFNFYEQDNTINGNWSPFLLKDPVFLVASIAKTSFKKAYTLFVNTCIQLQQLLKKTVEASVLSNVFNQLFEQLTNVFQTIEGWTNFMKNSSYEYNLKTYVINNVKETYSLLLWSLLEFQQALTKETIIPYVLPVNTFAFENYDQKIWKQSKGKTPYWNVLGLPTFPCEDDDPNSTQKCFYISNITADDVFTALQYTGKKVFSFYSNCISYADTELENIKEIPGHFPDTLLLRTFTSLLKIYQTQFNSLATSHLNFYYRDILLQTPKSMVADTVFASCELTKKINTYRLQKNIAFAAGVDANKQPILFETTNATSLNPAKIVTAYTLTTGKNDVSNTQLYLDKLPPVNVVTKDESGIVQQWHTFGSQQTPKGTAQNMSFAFGSPLLYLAEAKTRTITLIITLSNDAYSDIIQNNTDFYLSTADAWFKVLTPKRTISIENNVATLTITLANTDPVITAFTKNPDKYTSNWPLFKMSFSAYETTAAAPTISSIKINVDVVELQNFQLYNDFGALDATKPFQFLGPSPNVNENFMVGSNEVFSKPFSSLSLTLTWSPFSAGFDFGSYYKEYNDYLTNKYATLPVDEKYLEKIITEILKIIVSTFERILTAQESFYKKLLQKETTLIKGLLTNEIALVKKIIDTKIKDILELIEAESTIFKDMKSIFEALIEDLEKILEELLMNFENGTLDSEKITSTKNTALRKVDKAKNTITTKLNALKNTVASKDVSTKKSWFVEIGEKVENLFKKGDKKIIILTPFQYSNASFSVNFTELQNGLWQVFTHDEIGENNTKYAILSSDPANLFFPSEDTNTAIPPTRTFTFSGLDIPIEEVDPTLQKTLLQLTDTSETGFLKMQLIKPTYGFGTALYAKVVGAIALYNGNLIAHKSDKALVNPPNIPFTPIINKITGNYSAAATCDFSNSENAYPLECFYYTPFLNYKVYDTETGISAKDTTIGNSPLRHADGTLVTLTALPLIPNFTSQGQLFLELENVIAPAQLSFYFELARTYTEHTLDEKIVTFSYLSTTGWNVLPIVSNGTNNFSCSGIITVNIPEDCTTKHENMPGSNSWIAIGTTNNPDGFAKTTFLKTNGITLKRIINTSDVSEKAPQLKANIISSPATAIPEISATVQPFPSFGGKASETTQQMNSRVSTRLKTKDRLVTAEDYFNVIRLEFPEVYYSKTSYDQTAKEVITYLVKRVSDATVASAFEPLLSECTELAIQEYIKTRISAFTTSVVSNFTLQYVKISAAITIDSNYEITTVRKEINDGINIFLSPWITSAQAQITIDKGVNTAQIAAFINSFDAVIEVTKISFLIGSKNFTKGTISYGEDQEPKQEFTPASGALIVPSLNNITNESTITYSYHL